jgi:hypothetical protein
LVNRSSQPQPQVNPPARLYLDCDGAYDVGETPTTTGLNGRYAVTGIAAGTYHLRTDLPAGRTALWRQRGARRRHARRAGVVACRAQVCS